MLNVHHCLWYHPQGAKLPSEPMEVPEWRVKSCGISAARTNLPFLNFSTFLAGQDELFQLSGTGRAEKVEAGVSLSGFPEWKPVIAPDCRSGNAILFFLIAERYQSQVGVSVYWMSGRNPLRNLQTMRTTYVEMTREIRVFLPDTYSLKGV